MIHFLLYCLSMSIDNTIWHVINHFLPFFGLFSFYIFVNHRLNLISRSSNGSNHFIYISMPLDSVTWHARVGMFYALKPLLKSKSSTRNFSELFSLKFSLRIILLHLNNVHLFFNCILIKDTTTYLRLLAKLPKMTKSLYFHYFAFQIYIFVAVISRQTLVLIFIFNILSLEFKRSHSS